MLIRCCGALASGWTYATRYVGQYPELASSHRVLAEALDEAGQHDEAFAELQVGLSIEPDSDWAVRHYRRMEETGSEKPPPSFEQMRTQYAWVREFWEQSVEDLSGSNIEQQKLGALAARHRCHPGREWPWWQYIDGAK